MRELGANVLTDFGFAGEGGDDAVFADVEPCGDVVGSGSLWKWREGAVSCVAARGFCGDGEDGNAGTEELEEIAAGETEVMGGLGEEFVALGLDFEARRCERGAM